MHHQPILDVKISSNALVRRKKELSNIIKKIELECGFVMHRQSTLDIEISSEVFEKKTKTFF